MAYNSSSDDRARSLCTGLLEYHSQLVLIAQSSSSSVSRSTSPIHVQRFLPTPPPSPVSDDGPLIYWIEPAKPPRKFLELSAQLALECFHTQYLRYEVLPKAAIADYTRNLAKNELSYDELLILSIFTWHVNASIPVLLLRGINPPADSATALSELERKQLSESFSLSMIDANCTTFSEKYNATMGVELREDDFRWEVVTLIESLGYSFITFTIVSGALQPNFSLPSSLRFLARPALESFYEEVESNNNRHCLPEFIKLLTAELADKTLLTLFLLTLNVNPPAFRHGYLTGESIRLSQYERSLLAKSLWEPKLDQTLDQILARFSKLNLAKQELEPTVKLLPKNLVTIFENWIEEA
ncbi:hypothetical protein BJX63DRAFT_438315 [Aspergillus granulosus]|uniref:NR LBD domain-containing protein n=1 Tax=Aspergillus granulosus TaxID=176169 RepID=A0ABR4GSV0_9EURO